MGVAEAFFDTSVLLHLLSSEQGRADRVESLLESPGVISVQVLNEFASVATRKLGMPLAEAREVLATVRNVCRAEAVTVEDHDRALAIMQRYRFGLYDALIVASALRAGCKTLYCEDLQHQQLVDGQLRVVNPFG
jgi:predicted nucleic acid-binding protein